MDRSKLLQRAKLAEKTERYEDCAKYMSELVREQGQLKDEEERKLLMTSYKKVLDGCRTAQKTLASLVEEEFMHPGVTLMYREEVKKEQEKHCREILDLLDEFLISEDREESGMENLVYYTKMKADFFIYFDEVIDRLDRDRLIDQIKYTYEKAMDYSRRLPATNPTRLGVYLSTSVFLHEHGGDKEEACKLANEACDEAKAEITEKDLQREDLDPESIEIMDQIRDHLALWRGASSEEF